jgi:tRNA 2-thiouridine synthesizing protein A
VEADHVCVLDAGRTACGDLILLIFQQMKLMATGQRLVVLAHDDGAEADVPAWCRSTGNALVEVNVAEVPKRFVIEKR